jgi:hypothetical protein
MKRRGFIMMLGGAAAAWPLAARAHLAQRMRRIGVLIALAESDPEAQPRIGAFDQGLEKLGWIDDEPNKFVTLASEDNLFERILDRLWGNAEGVKPGHTLRGDIIDLHELHLSAAQRRPWQQLRDACKHTPHGKWYGE